MYEYDTAVDSAGRVKDTLELVYPLADIIRESVKEYIDLSRTRSFMRASLDELTAAEAKGTGLLSAVL